VHLAAFLLAKCFRKPHVLDFREPWYVNGSLRIPETKARAVSQLETWAKRAIVRRAACVICMSEGERDDLRAEFPQKDPQTIIYIPNGFDPTDFPEAITWEEAPPRLSLIHTGTIYDGIAAEFFGALLRLVEAHPETARSIEVHLVGEISYKYSYIVDTLSSAGIVRVHGLQPYEKTLRMVQRSDVPVMLMGGSSYFASHLPSKLFEYLYVGKPIFAIAPEGEVTGILKRSGLGIVVQPHSVESVVTALRNIVADHSAGRLGRAPNKAYIRTFERVALAEKLACALDAVKEAALVRKQDASR
jgi:glycosyltransferase involved in cell wall biosynthesis